VDDLYVNNELKFEKTADVQMPREEAEWESEIIRHIAEEHPYLLEDTNYNITFKELDPDEGNAFGGVMITRNRVMNKSKRGTRKQEPVTNERIAIVPIVIQDFVMKPLDTFIFEGQHFMTTPERWAMVMGNPELGSKVAAPNTRAESIAHYTWPPAEAAYGSYGAYQGIYHYAADSSDAGASKNVNDQLFVQAIANAMYKSDLDGFRRRVKSDPTILAAFAKNKTLHIVKKLMDITAMSERDIADAAYNMLPANVIRVEAQGMDKFQITQTSDYQYMPKQCILNFDETVGVLKDVVPDIRERLMAESDLFITLRDQKLSAPVLFEDVAVLTKPVKENGRYYVITDNGEIREGTCVTNIIDYDGENTGLVLFADGNCHSLQENISAEYISNTLPIKGRLQTGAAATFYWMEDGRVRAFLPFVIKSYLRENGRDMIRAVDYWKNPITFIKTPETQRPVYGSGARNTEVGGLLDQNVIYIPETYEVMHLGNRVRLMNNPYSINQLFQAELRKQVGHANLQEPDGGLEIMNQDGEYSMRGPLLNGVYGVEEKDYMSRGDVKFTLIVLGASIDKADEILDKCDARNRCTVGGLRPVNSPELAKTAEEFLDLEKLCKSLRKDLVKEAAELHDEDSVDKVLALGFVNKDNLSQFLESLPAFQETETKLAELLTLSRVGLRDIDESAISSALRSMNDVNQKLEYIQSTLDGKSQDGKDS